LKAITTHHGGIQHSLPELHSLVSTGLG